MTEHDEITLLSLWWEDYIGTRNPATTVTFKQLTAVEYRRRYFKFRYMWE